MNARDKRMKALAAAIGACQEAEAQAGHAGGRDRRSFGFHGALLARIRLAKEVAERIGPAIAGPIGVHRFIDHRVFQHSLHVAAGFHERDALDPVDPVHPAAARIARPKSAPSAAWPNAERSPW